MSEYVYLKNDRSDNGEVLHYEAYFKDILCRNFYFDVVQFFDYGRKSFSKVFWMSPVSYFAYTCLFNSAIAVASLL